MSDTTDVQMLQQRIRKLERGLRLLTWASLVAACGFASAFLVHRSDFYKRQRTLLASSYVLLGSDGANRARLGVYKDGTLALRMLDAEGRVRAELKVPVDGEGSLRFYDASGRPVAPAP